MGIKEFQDFLETECSSACVSVDLLKISRAFVPKRRPVARLGQVGGPSESFCVVVDAESCLDRLYGGYFSDWVCGGQWNRMMSFLSNLVQACQNANMELVVFFNGALENKKINEWMSQQLAQRDKVHYVLRHIANKGTPPPKVWWNQPVFLKEALKMALRQLGVTVACSMDDHQQEVNRYCREHSLQGIIAQDSVYIIFDPPRYFSSNNLKLTYKGSLETKEYIRDEIAKCMNLNPNRFCIFAALLGNHILTDEDLSSFRELMPAADTGKPRRSREKLDVEMVKATCDYVRNLPAVDNLEVVGNDIFKLTKTNKGDLVERFKESVQYFVNETQDGFYKRYQHRGPAAGQAYGGPHMSLHSHQVSAHTDTRSQGKGTGDAQNKKGQVLPQASSEILRVAIDRHEKGLMHYHIYQVLTQGEVKLPVILEDDTTRELPSYVDLYRPLRQTIYSVLLNLNKQKIVHEIQNKDKSNVQQPDFSAQVKEWVVRRGSGRPTYEVVTARPVDWKAPSIQRMWLGQQDGDKDRRLRAFLTIMMSDNSLMLNTNYVPQHLLVLCTVLRYMMQFGRILQRQELDAFLAMSVSPLLHDVQTMQDLKLPSILPRGSQLASLFMAGIETAALANDVCGAPIPWTMICPWLYMDGKLFHFKLLKANNNTPLIDICDGQMEQVLRVERLRQAILENIHVDFAKPLLPGFYYPYSSQPYSGSSLPYSPGPLRGSAGGRGRGILGKSPIEAQGGQLEIAGVVVGQWGPNMSNRRTRGQLPPQVMSVGHRERGLFNTRSNFILPRGGLIRGRSVAPVYSNRGQYRPAYYSRGRAAPTKRPVRIVARPGRGRTVKSTPSKGRGVTVDVSSTMKSTSVEQDYEEADEEVNGDYSGATEDEDDGDSAPASINV